MNRKWTRGEIATLRRWYPEGGVEAVQKHIDRKRGGIINQASKLGISCSRQRGPSSQETRAPLAPLPRMDLLESLACVQLRKWRGPVSHGPLRPAIGVAA